VTPEGAELAFLVAMIWGYGPVGYGAWRTARVLADNPHACDRLADLAVVARDHGGLAAFDELAAKPLRYLGVAFGTKYLRFVTAALSADNVTTPILDSVVRRWLATHAGLRLNIDDWRSADYRQYFALLTSWSAELGLTADAQEELIFRSAISAEGSALWSEKWVSSATSPAGGAQSMLRELERLFDTANTESASAARHHLDELARIIEQGWST
jgi:8-oxoguanine DNA glycosylase-like protein